MAPAPGNLRVFWTQPVETHYPETGTHQHRGGNVGLELDRIVKVFDMARWMVYTV